MDQTLKGRAGQLGRHRYFGLETEKTHHVQQHQSGYVRLSRLPGHATLRSAVKYNSLQQMCIEAEASAVVMFFLKPGSHQTKWVWGGHLKKGRNKQSGFIST